MIELYKAINMKKLLLILLLIIPIFSATTILLEVTDSLTEKVKYTKTLPIRWVITKNFDNITSIKAYSSMINTSDSLILSVDVCFSFYDAETDSLITTDTVLVKNIPAKDYVIVKCKVTNPQNINDKSIMRSTVLENSIKFENN